MDLTVFFCIIAVIPHAVTVGLLFREPVLAVNTRITSASSTLLSNVKTYSACTQKCLSQFGETCTFVNYNTENQVCEISDSDLTGPYVYTAAQEEGWSHKVVPHSMVVEWANYFDGWDLVCKASSNIGVSIYDLWSGSAFTSSPAADLLQLQTKSTSHFKSEKVEDWANLNIKKVKFAFYDGGVEVLALVFNGEGTTKTNWFSKGRLLEDPYTDLTTTATANYFSISGWSSRRRFYINREHGGCTSDAGWLVVVDPAVESCAEWDGQAPGTPYFFYSKSTTSFNWSQNYGTSNVGYPDIMAIFVQYN